MTSLNMPEGPDDPIVAGEPLLSTTMADWTGDGEDAEAFNPRSSVYRFLLILIIVTLLSIAGVWILDGFGPE